jgi:GxxExxY protein
VEKCVIVEVKAVERLERVHTYQVVSYLKATKLRVGLLINFNTDWLKGSIRRIVL